MAETKLQEILEKHELLRKVSNDLAFNCQVYRLKNDLQKEAVNKELKTLGYSTYWDSHNYFNSLLQNRVRISPRIAHAALARTVSQLHRDLLFSGNAVFLYCGNYGLVMPPTEKSGDSDTFFI